MLVADRIPFAQDRVVSMSTANKIGMLLFDLATSQRASLKISAVSVPLVTVSVKNPIGQTVSNQTVSGAGGFIDTVNASPTGTYAIVVDPLGTNTGSLTLRLYDVPADQTGAITLDGTTVVVSATVPGQNIRRAFTGVAGQRVSVKATGSLSPGATISLRQPNDAILGSTLIGGFLDPMTLPVNGQYAVLVDPTQDSLNSVTVRAWDVPADATGTGSVGAAGVPFTTTTPGQNSVLSFTGTVSARVSVTLAAAFSMSGSATLRDPGGASLGSKNIGGTTVIEPVILPANGTYTVLIDPLSDLTGTVTATVNSVPADVTGTITPGGTPEAVVITAAGQNGSLTFSGIAGQRVSLGVAAGAPLGGVEIRKPDQTSLGLVGMGGSATFLDTLTLPTTATYTVFVNPTAQHTGTATITLYDVPADLAGSITVGGSALPVSPSVPGQKATVTFAGTGTQQVTVHVTGNSIGQVTVTLRRPDGSTLTSSTSSAGSFNLTTQTLPTSGTYSVFINPSQAATGSLNVSVSTP